MSDEANQTPEQTGRATGRATEGALGPSARAAVMEHARAVAGEPPTPRLRSIVCPYCGAVTPDTGRCGVCAGRFDPLSRQATQNQMGPWAIRDERSPFRPGCAYDTLARLIDQGKVTTETVLRGPSTRQFWMLARHAPGVAHRLGVCHNCQTPVKPDAFACPNCHAPFSVERDRQHLGLGPARPLGGQGMPEVLALRAEPASVGGRGAIASAPLGGPEEGSGPDGSPPTDMAARRQIEEANQLAQRWRQHSDATRRRAWVVMIAAAVLMLLSMGYTMMR